MVEHQILDLGVEGSIPSPVAFFSCCFKRFRYTSGMLKTTREIITLCLILLLFMLEGLQIFKNRNLQTQIDELKIIVNERFLPAMIFNKNDFNVR